jgi:hypothetical protein
MLVTNKRKFNQMEEESQTSRSFALENQELFQGESNYHIQHNYLAKHEVRNRMILIDWLMELCEQSQFQRQTFYLAVNYVDRFLAAPNKRIQTNESNLQLVGACCVYLAAKVQEVDPQDIPYYVDQSKNSYTNEDMIYMEREILAVLQWNLTPSTCYSWLMCLYSFMNRNLTMHSPLFISDKMLQQTMVLLDKITMHSLFFNYLPSQLVVGALSTILESNEELIQSLHTLMNYNPAISTACIAEVKQFQKKFGGHCCITHYFNHQQTYSKQHMQNMTQ